MEHRLAAPATPAYAAPVESDEERGRVGEDCDCEYADRDWHDRFKCVEEDLSAVVAVLLAAESTHDTEYFKRFVALHSWTNPAAVYDLAEIVEHYRKTLVKSEARSGH